MRCFQVNQWRFPVVKGFLPPEGTKAPVVPGPQTGEIVFRPGGDQVIAHIESVAEKVLRHDRTNGMRTEILLIGVATAVPEIPGKGLHAAGLKFRSKNISCHKLLLKINLEAANLFNDKSK